MTTLKQIDANRRNARKSTGPQRKANSNPVAMLFAMASPLKR
jgi:hypothetical protein